MYIYDIFLDAYIVQSTLEVCFYFGITTAMMKMSFQWSKTSIDDSIVKNIILGVGNQLMFRWSDISIVKNVFQLIRTDMQMRY